MISFEREILATLRRRNPDLLNAFVCLGLAAGTDGVVTMTAPGPLAHVPHKRRAGMISALAAAGYLKRVPGGYLVHGVGSEATDNEQTENTAPTADREAPHSNISQNSSGRTAVQQAVNNNEASQEDSILEDVAELARGEQWEDLPPEEGGGATDNGQTEDRGSSATREASHCNASQDNSEWTEGGQEENSKALTDAFIDISDLDEPGDIEGMAALESLLDALPAKPQSPAPIMSMGLRRGFPPSYDFMPFHPTRAKPKGKGIFSCSALSAHLTHPSGVRTTVKSRFTACMIIIQCTFCLTCMKQNTK